MKKLIILIITLCLVAFIIGCGGGGGSTYNDSTPTTITILGKVLDENGDPVEGIYVDLFDKKGDQINKEDIPTDDDGNYSFTGIKPGEYKIMAENRKDNTKIGYSSYEKYNASNTEYKVNILYTKPEMNKSSEWFDYISKINYVSTTSKTTFYKYDGSFVLDGYRNINYAFGFDTTTKKVDFSGYVKFDDGSISYLQAKNEGNNNLSTILEVKICDGNLNPGENSNIKVKKEICSREYFPGLGIFFVNKFICISDVPNFESMIFYISPDLGWIVKYEDEIDETELVGNIKYTINSVE